MKQLMVGLAVLVLCGCAAAVPDPPTPAPAAALPSGSGGVNSPDGAEAPYVVLISIDGFRPDYLERGDTPHLRRLVTRGARARAMTPVFPTLTFPNHYSLVTGLHPGHHGIVANSFYDPDLDRSYSLADRDAVGDPVWYGGEPIWVTAETQGMVAACFFWPGSEAPVRGVRPTFWNIYDAAIPNEARIEQVLEWLRMPAERRPHLITLYFSDIDTASHRGPLDSPAVADALRTVDRQLGALVDGLDALPIRDRVYVIVTSDHGMIETSAQHVVRLDTLVDLSEVRVGFSGPVTALHVGGDPSRARALRDAINAGLSHGRAWLRTELPERWHFRTNPRSGDVVVVMDPPWRLSAGPDRRLSQEPFGTHGWDPSTPEMQAFFLAIGPGIRPGTIVERIDNVDVYPFLTEILGLTPAANIDGHAGAVRRALGVEISERALIGT